MNNSLTYPYHLNSYLRRKRLVTARFSRKIKFKIRRAKERIGRAYHWFISSWIMAWFRPIRTWHLKRKLNYAMRALDNLDFNMHRAGWSRTKRRQFWRDFTKKRNLRNDVMNHLTQ